MNLSPGSQQQFAERSRFTQGAHHDRMPTDAKFPADLSNLVAGSSVVQVGNKVKDSQWLRPAFSF
jgi:hypothetical protein